MKIDKFLNESLLFSIVKSAEYVRKELQAGLREHGLNFYQSLILVALYTEKNPSFTPGDFTSTLSLSKAIVSQSLTKLEELKLISRKYDELDARRSIIQLSQKGRKKASQLMNVLHQLDEQVESRLEKKSIRLILEGLKSISF